ncbi:hypothetical protein ACTXQV_68265, partial [Klebsiella pneumoniae]
DPRRLSAATKGTPPFRRADAKARFKVITVIQCPSYSLASWCQNIFKTYWHIHDTFEQDYETEVLTI